MTVIPAAMIDDTLTAGRTEFSCRRAQPTRLRQRRSRRRIAFQARRIRVLRDGTLAAADEHMGMMMRPLFAGARERATFRDTGWSFDLQAVVSPRAHKSKVPDPDGRCEVFFRRGPAR